MREYLLCKCGREMLVSAFDIKEKVVSYRCPKCDESKIMSFEDSEKLEDDNYKYFILNQDGTVCWKCHEHGSCEMNIGSGENLNTKALDTLYNYDCPYYNEELDRNGDTECIYCNKYFWEEDDEEAVYFGDYYCSINCVINSIIEAESEHFNCNIEYEKLKQLFMNNYNLEELKKLILSYKNDVNFNKCIENAKNKNSKLVFKILNECK